MPIAGTDGNHTVQDLKGGLTDANYAVFWANKVVVEINGLALMPTLDASTSQMVIVDPFDSTHPAFDATLGTSGEVDFSSGSFWGIAGMGDYVFVEVGGSLQVVFRGDVFTDDVISVRW